MSSTEIPQRRGLPRWLKVTIITTLVLANLAVLGIYWIIRVGENALAEAETDDRVTDVLDIATDDLTFLVVGSDSRAGLTDLDNFGSAGGERGDVIMLVKFSRDGVVTMLSIPRDLWVDIPGNGKNKINAAYAFGGPTLMVQTIKENLGVEINHYVEIDFVGFMAMVDELGGIDIFFPNPARDLSSGLDVEAGMQTLSGDMALAYARSRKYQELQGGSWVSVNANDIGRTGRQQEVVRAILSELKSPSSITEAGSIASSLARHTTVDSRLASSSVAQLAWDFKSVIGGDIDGATLPVFSGTEGNASVVYASQPEASTMLDNFKAGRPLAEQPTRIQVLNGNGVAGAAGEMAERLEALGFIVVAVGDAGSIYETTTILIDEGSQAGDMVRSALGFGEVLLDDVDNRYDAVVIVGTDAA
ncbi:MAG: LCP family protein [Acidimicrobiia bacterium]|nr:LCP family protein [Acidimicrobiia bacterium]